MTLLCIETATAQVGVAIRGEGVDADFHLGPKNRHVESLVPAIEFLTTHTGVSMDMIETVVVDIGPGLFTGLRVGLATAKAIAFAQQVPLVGVCSLDLLALAVATPGRPVVAVVDGRREEVFHARYQLEDGRLRRLTEPAVSKASDLAETLREMGGPHLVTGDGAHLYAEAFKAVPDLEFAPFGQRWPKASAGIEIAADEGLRAALAMPTDEPLYLRPPQIHKKVTKLLAPIEKRQ